MTQPAITPLRQRMIEDIALRRLAPRTQAFYVNRPQNSTCISASLPTCSVNEDVRAYQLHLVHSGLDVGSVNRAVTALCSSIG